MIISYAQNFEDVMLWRALKHVENGFYIDVGANDPVTDSVTLLFYENHWHGINIEPLQSHWQELQRVRPRDINLQCAVGAFDGEISIWDCGVRGLATADEEVIAHHVSNGHSGHYTTVHQTTLKRICLQHDPSEVHFLKIDVEGFERAVLDGMDFQRYRPWIVVIEATRPNITLEVHIQWESLLLGANYLFVYADGLNRFYVACEHQELEPSFRYPPNFFDHFVKAPHIEDNLWAQTITTRALQAEVRAQIEFSRANNAENRTKDLLVQLSNAEVRIDNLLKSSSWQVTRPLRIVSSGLKLVRAGNGLATQISGAVRNLASYRLLKSIGIRVLNHSPPFKLFLGKLMYSSGFAYKYKDVIPVHLAHLPPRVRTLYTSLRREWKLSQKFPDSSLLQPGERRLRLAYVSPLPPARSGIADYSLELLPALAQFYTVDVILDQPKLSDNCIENHFKVRDSQWLLQNSANYDRVLYHFGNSSYHCHMFSLLAHVPGLVVLHDFCLVDILNYLEAYGVDAFAWQRVLYKSHGYGALAKSSVLDRTAKIAECYPANLEVLQLAQGIIVHSQYAKQLVDGMG